MSAWRARLHAALGPGLGLPLERADRPGTTFLVDPERKPDGWQALWSIGRHCFVKAEAGALAMLRELAGEEETLDAAHVRARLGGRVLDLSTSPHHACDPARFRRQSPPVGCSARELGPADTAAFAMFRSRCPDAELREADVALEHDRAFGIFADGRLLAVASTYRLYGLVDIGVITAPDVRGRGLGRAVVSALTGFHLKHEPGAILLYRHETENAGSAALVRALGFPRWGLGEFVKLAA